MSFAVPLALFGLLAIPALVAIYWLRNRSRRRVVSSLMLWMDQRQLKEGGLLIHRLQTPLLFFLELLAILLLVVAAAGPIVRAGDAASPLVVVLDDSFSMLAGGNDSPRSRAEQALKTELRGRRFTTARIVLAGDAPQLLGEVTDEVTGDAQQLGTLLDQWKCLSPSASLEESITFAFAVGGDRARVLILTDHMPPETPASERLEWRAFGQRKNNVAFVNATRTSRDGQDRCMLEIANLSDSRASTELVVETVSPSDSSSGKELQRSRIDLPPNGDQRIVLTLAAGAGPLRARIAGDSLGIDNEAILLRDRQTLVRVQISVQDHALREIAESAISSIAIASPVSENPEIVITDEPDRAASAGSWLVRIVGGQDAESYVGPFVLDRNHPLTEGLSLDGVVWGASKSAQPAGNPVIMAGNVPLLTEVEHAAGVREVRVWFRPDLSTLQRTPGWPVLMWNLISWRASELAGVSQTNVRLGSEARVRLPAGATAVQVKVPDGATREIPAMERAVSLKAEAPGVYEVGAGGEKYQFAANALRKEESDLRSAVSGSWGGLPDADGGESALHNIAWVFLLLLMLVLALHLTLSSRTRAAT